jgi:ABC-type spermidine/putrescine transport system permease subunit I
MRAQARLLPLVPALLIFGLLYIAPLFLMLLYSFWTVENFRMVPRWTLDNYSAFLMNAAYLRVFAYTIVIALVATLLALLISYPLAYYAAKVVKRGRLFLILFIVIPFWTSFVVRAYAWATILGARGLINTLLITLGVIDEPIQELLYSPFSLVIGLLCIYLPFMTLSIYASLVRLDDRLLDAAADLYAAPARSFWRITFPLTLPGVIAGSIFVFIPILGEYVVPNVLGGVSGFFIANIIVNLFGQSGQWGQGSAIAFCMMAFIIATLIAFRRVLEPVSMYRR